MFAVAGGPSFAGSPLTWSLLFARQPEPDLEFTEEELEQTTNVRSSSSIKPPKKSGGRPLLWLLMLLLVGVGAYVAMEPEVVTDWLGPLLGESPMPKQPPIAARPVPPVPKPSAPAGQPDTMSPSPSAPSVPMPQAGTPSVPSPTPAPAPVPGMPTASLPAPTPVSPTGPSAIMPPVTSPASPLFGEGQKVTAMLNPGMPEDTVILMQDSAGTRPGPTIRPGTTLTILDGDLQNSGWVYSVRSDDGAKGWISEKRLRLKP